MITYRQPFRGEYRISQGYGEKDTSDFHTGIDYLCPTGTEILASADGIVMWAGWMEKGWGNLVILFHTNQVSTVYAHLYDVTVKPGQQVKQGELIGYSGNTGNSTGPHLHFEARKSWADYNSHFDPNKLPLMCVYDEDVKPCSGGDPITSGVYQVACAAAYVRSWANLVREKLVYRGDRVFVFDDKKEYAGLTFYYIGAGSAMAAVDNEGTILLEKCDGEEE